MKKTLTTLAGVTTLLASFAFAFVFPVEAQTAEPNWNTTDDYVINMEYLGDDSLHDVTLVQDNAGNLSGTGGSPSGSTTYQWTINDGVVTGDNIVFTADYTATSDAVTPQTTLIVDGIVASDGTVSGTWSDNYQGNERSGTLSTVSGTATPLPADQNGDDFIDTAEGIPFYGDIAVSLTETGDTSPDSALALDRFPTADSTGAYTYTRTFIVSDTVRDTMTDGHIVVHGLDIDNSGAYDGEKESSIAAGVPFEATVPVACGLVEGTAGEFTADLNQLNSTGVNGSATLVLTGNEVTVVMNVTGTSADLPHAQHIHIGGNDTCPPNTAGAPAPVDESTTVTVTIEKFVQGSMATAITADAADFPMTATYNAENIGAGTGSYTLGDMNDVPYQVMTSDMTKGVDYETSEILTGDVVSAECNMGTPFALEGYTTGDSRAEAIAATPVLTTPTFTDLQNNKHVIVWNIDCSIEEGELNGDVIGEGGELEVTSIEMTDTTATANGSFADGWAYVFHVTVPDTEPNVAMKFEDWMQTNGTGFILVDDNMRISSLQADNGGATILLTAANVYSTPDLHMVTDLDPAMDGIQVEITVEVAVPVSTPNGAYTTAYGVQSNS